MPSAFYMGLHLKTKLYLEMVTRLKITFRLEIFWRDRSKVNFNFWNRYPKWTKQQSVCYSVSTSIWTDIMGRGKCNDWSSSENFYSFYRSIWMKILSNFKILIGIVGYYWWNLSMMHSFILLMPTLLFKVSVNLTSPLIGFYFDLIRKAFVDWLNRDFLLQSSNIYW